MAAAATVASVRSVDEFMPIGGKALRAMDPEGCIDLAGEGVIEVADPEGRLGDVCATTVDSGCFASRFAISVAAPAWFSWT